MTITEKQLANLRLIAEDAALSLRSARERFEARKPAYQEGFTPAWLTTAETYYAHARKRYEHAEAEYNAAREDGAK